MKVEVEVALTIKGQKIILTKDEARKLFKELGQVFPNESPSPMKIESYNPYRPYGGLPFSIKNSENIVYKTDI
jgi:hypothetical protein